ncbi:hypothetical protein K1719_035799 [Acacia pycnantha]|nr:hypothetical protein K1719_035730 [Acacia pycnantha]KAI9082376.1 hypothetical protein K1719_035799 [Acacia pycnantha]
MDGYTAEDLSTIGGIATVSILHSFIPTHWLPFSIVGRAQKWTLSRTLLVTALGAILHVISTSLLGITAITMANAIAGEEKVHKLASLLLIFLGGSYVLLFLFGKGGHSHSHNQPMEKMAVAGLILVPALSPCATTLPVFLAAGNSSSMMVVAIIVLLFSTVSVMTSLVAVSFYGASQLKFQWVERYDKLVVGSVLCLVGVLTLAFHHHDGEEHSSKTVQGPRENKEEMCDYDVVHDVPLTCHQVLFSISSYPIIGCGCYESSLDFPFALSCNMKCKRRSGFTGERLRTWRIFDVDIIRSDASQFQHLVLISEEYPQSSDRLNPRILGIVLLNSLWRRCNTIEG